MRIGIISINMYTKGLNFASPLHTFAFQQFLKQRGIESTVIDYKPIYYGRFDLRHPYDFYRRVVDRRLASGNTEDLDMLVEKMEGYKALYEQREVRHDKFQDFIERNYVKTDECFTSDLLEVKDPGFDCYICVTDVIWKNEPGHGFDRGFFLGSKAMENKWKIAYAASRGVYFAADQEDERRFTHYVEDIDFISVREKSLQEYLQGIVEKDVSLVLDPVLLMDRQFYESLAIKPEESGYVFLYYVMEQAKDTIAQAVSYARSHGLKIVEVTDRPLPKGRLQGYEGVEVVYRYDVGIEEWLGYFLHADAVFTNSFHATCFSILFEKELFVGSRHGDKVTNILDIFGMGHRRLSRLLDAGKHAFDSIDYGHVRAVLDQKRKESADFILGAIAYAQTHERPASDYEWWQREQRYPMVYKCNPEEGLLPEVGGWHDSELTYEEDGCLRFEPSGLLTNDGLSRFQEVPVFCKGRRLKGWKVRFKIDNRFFLYLADGTYVIDEEYDKGIHGALKVFGPGDRIPFIPVDRIKLMVAKPVWNKHESKEAESLEVILNSGAKLCQVDEAMVEQGAFAGLEVVQTPGGSLEFKLAAPAINDGGFGMPPNPFLRDGFVFKGWKARVKCGGKWYWLLTDGSFIAKESRTSAHKLQVIPEGLPLPLVPSYDAEMVVLEAVWGKPAQNGSWQKIKKRLRG